MWNWLKKMRTKPKAVRDQLAFGGAAFVTALIALAWIATLPGHFAAIEVEDSPEQEAAGAFAQFFSEAKQNLGSVFSAQFTKATSSAATSSNPSSNKSTGIEIPVLKPETISKVKASSTAETTAPSARPVLIGTTTKEASSTSQ